MQVECLAHDHLGLTERARRIAHALGVARGHVAPRMDVRRLRPKRVVERRDRRERLVLDLERVERVLGAGGALGDHQGHRLPRVGDDLLGKNLGTHRRHEARVRDQERQSPERGDVGRQEDVHDARPRPARRGRGP